MLAPHGVTWNKALQVFLWLVLGKPITKYFYFVAVLCIMANVICVVHATPDVVVVQESTSLWSLVCEADLSDVRTSCTITSKQATY